MKIARVLLLALAAVVFAASLVLAQDMAPLIQDLGAAAPEARQNAREKLAESGAPAVAPLVRVLYGEQGTAHLNAKLALELMVSRASRPGLAPERQAISRALIEQASDSSLPAAARCLALEMASLTVGRESVARLVRLLKDEETRESARVALTRMRDPAGGKALADSLKDASDSLQIAILGGLAERGEGDSARAVADMLRSSNRDVRLKAIETLGSLPGERSASEIWNIVGQVRGEERDLALRAFLNLADLEMKRGRREAAYGMYEKAYGAAEQPVLKSAALIGMARSDGGQALEVLTLSLSSPEGPIWGAAVQALMETKDPQAAARLTSAMKDVGAPARVRIVNILAGRSEPVASDALLAAARDEDPQVRTAALGAIAGKPGIDDSRKLRVLTDGFRDARSTGEKLVIARALRALADPSSEELLREMAGDPDLKSEALPALLAVAGKLAQTNRREQATAAYRKVLDESSDAEVVREASAGLRKLGVGSDLAPLRGYIANWWVLGPIPGRAQWQIPNAISTGEPPDVLRPWRIGDKNYEWRYVNIDDAAGELDLRAVLGEHEDAIAYAYAVVFSAEAREARFRFGSDDDGVVWLNFQRVHQFLGDRSWVPDQDVVTVRLREGNNHILLKVMNGGGGWGASLRITDPDGKPLVLPQRRP